VQRAGTYKAFNAADQGSAADIMKMALVAVYESGVCDIIKPYITVHDELDFGAPISKAGDEATAEVKRIMENVYELKVPTVVDVETGDNWGSVKAWEYKRAT
jgi:DNA polymerase-1